MGYKINPFTGAFDKDSKGQIPEYTTDPTSPSKGDTWVLKVTSEMEAGEGMGLLLALTYTGSVSNFTLKYRTTNNTTAYVQLL